MRPLIGITSDNKDNAAHSGTYECAARYARAVAEAGGLPVMLPQEVGLVDDYLQRCDGFLFTGGVDPDVRAFGHDLHPQARVMDPQRQAFEAALLEALRDAKPQAACLGVCLGMQMMALTAGGRLNQFMPETMGQDAAAVHQKNRRHPVVLRVNDAALRETSGVVASSHRQAVEDPGRMRVVATAPDGVVEAIDDPTRPFYVGVQWHPERGDQPGDGEALNLGLIRAFVDAARAAR